MDQKQVKEFLTALDSIIKEKGIEKEVVIEAMEQAMVAAFKKKTGNPNGRCKVNEDTGEIKLYSFKTVVEEVNDDRLEISLEDAKKIVPDIEIGETIEKEEELKDFSRVAAGTAKQVVVQRVKEAEKKIVSDAFSDKKDEMLVGILSREDAKNYYVDLGKAHGVLKKNEIIRDLITEVSFFTAIWNKLFCRTVLIDSKGDFIPFSRGIYVGEDALWLSKVLKNAEIVTSLSEPLYYWKRREDSATQGNTKIRTDTKYLTVLDAYKYMTLEMEDIINRRIMCKRYLGCCRDIMIQAYKEKQYSLSKQLQQKIFNDEKMYKAVDLFYVKLKISVLFVKVRAPLFMINFLKKL